MKKDLIFAPALLLVGVALGLLTFTGMNAHIALSIVGVLVLAAYTVLTRKEWKILPLEIAMRALYGLALISGILLKIRYVATVGMAHKVFAALFVVALIALLVQKLITAKKAA